MMYNALSEYKGAEENCLLPYYSYSIYYDHYSTILNIVYCLLGTSGTSCCAPLRCHSPEPSLAPEKLVSMCMNVYLKMYTCRYLVWRSVSLG